MSNRDSALVEGSALYRRIEFLINEARHAEKRDQVITFTMRVLSNYATIGKDAGSSKIKDENRTVSSGAFEFLQTVPSLRDWHTKTINEHPLPLKAIWTWILSQSQTITPDDVWTCFLDHPMITVTKSEDALISKHGLRSKASDDRYAKLGIQTVLLDDAPRQLILSRLAASDKR